MTQEHATSSQHLLGSIGLALLGLLGWACDQRSRPSHPALASVRRVFWSAVIESIAAIGWAVDHLYPVQAANEVTGMSGGDIHVEPRKS